jgi:hypothetical protein
LNLGFGEFSLCVYVSAREMYGIYAFEKKKKKGMGRRERGA